MMGDIITRATRQKGATLVAAGMAVLGLLAGCAVAVPEGELKADPAEYREGEFDRNYQAMLRCFARNPARPRLDGVQDSVVVFDELRTGEYKVLAGADPHVLVEFRAVDEDRTEVRAHSVAGITYALQPVGSGMDDLWTIVENCEDPLLGG